MAEREPEQINFAEELMRCISAIPFVPFDIVTAGGDRYEVHDRLQVATGGDAIVLVLPRTGIQVVRKNQITALHVHEPIR
ncbi:MAG: hypothetical protein ABSH08_00295 [Tepidisphaeraceae bacterium]|jgi:hypothetical protein